MNDNEFDKNFIKLKIIGVIVFTLTTFIGIVFLESFEIGNEFAKNTTDY